MILSYDIYNQDKQSATTFNFPFVYFTSTSTVCKANAHLASFADLDIDSFKYVNGLWSVKIWIFEPIIISFNLVRVQTIAYASFSIVAHLCCVSVSFWQIKEIGRSNPQLSCWVRTAPTAQSLLSQHKLNGFVIAWLKQARICNA